MKRALSMVVLALGCAEPGDLLYEPEPNAPVEVAPGLFRLTTNLGNDFVRGVTAEGRVLYIAHGLAGVSADASIVSVSPEGGSARNEAALYRHPGEQFFQRATREDGDLLMTLLPPLDGSHTCGSLTFPAPKPPFVGWHLTRLPVTPGAALAGLAQLRREFPVIVGVGYTSSGLGVTPKRIRIVPAIAEAARLGTNPWGPAVSGNGQFASLSDAVSILRFDLSDTAAVPVVLATGAYPVLSRDESVLYFARPNVVDSSQTVTIVPYLFPCTQTMVEYSVNGWTLVRRVLATGVEDTLGLGAEPTLAGDTALIVRRADGLYVVRTSDTVSSLLVADSTVTSPALAPDGSFIAFTSRRFGNADVLVLRLN